MSAVTLRTIRKNSSAAACAPPGNEVKSLNSLKPPRLLLSLVNYHLLIKYSFPINNQSREFVIFFYLYIGIHLGTYHFVVIPTTS